MKKLRIKISKWFGRLDEWWRQLPVKRQHRYTLLLFAGYALLSLVTVLEVWYDVLQSNNKITIEHINNPVIGKRKSPVLPQDSISKILKNKLYER
ncbi:nitrogen regulatory IIA protein [Elizabethkingia bruuniana]|uniref:nitrogen regulatory IIA protein n=1 Tax=Elizabethkingia bruuniana TaxID=1756149 RepID=UPI00099A1B3D|nr:nitrogen regulatory IIA protein [Elizabethkingia bruuniana]OPC66489.1 nitrogen regulatory IIA protein [Elizabethkingia bruuniana]